jgi:hypothetical protein
MCNQRYQHVYYVDLGLISYKDIILMIALVLGFVKIFLRILQFIIPLF